jgi:hypothetical protein
VASCRAHAFLPEVRTRNLGRTKRPDGPKRCRCSLQHRVPDQSSIMPRFIQRNWPDGSRHVCRIKKSAEWPLLRRADLVL